MPRRILVVEDDDAVRALVAKVLKAENYDVAAVANGCEARTKLDELVPEVLIVDVMLPDIDGMELVRSVKAEPRWANLPVIFLTARSDVQSMVAGVDAGARYYVTKPFAIEDLLAKVSRALAPG